VADFTASYDFGAHFGIESVKAGISVLNIFDRRYVSEISPNDTDLSAGANYYAGAPRTVVGSLSMKF
jgi:iron complex outermembrane receptor protein